MTDRDYVEEIMSQLKGRPTRIVIIDRSGSGRERTLTVLFSTNRIRVIFVYSSQALHTPGWDSDSNLHSPRSPLGAILYSRKQGILLGSATYGFTNNSPQTCTDSRVCRKDNIYKSAQPNFYNGHSVAIGCIYCGKHHDTLPRAFRISGTPFFAVYLFFTK